MWTIVCHIQLKINTEVIVLRWRCWNVLLLQIFLSDRIRVERCWHFLITTWVQLFTYLRALWQDVLLELRKQFGRVLLGNWRLRRFPLLYYRSLSDYWQWTQSLLLDDDWRKLLWLPAFHVLQSSTLAFGVPTLNLHHLEVLFSNLFRAIVVYFGNGNQISLKPPVPWIVNLFVNRRLWKLDHIVLARNLGSLFDQLCFEGFLPLLSYLDFLLDVIVRLLQLEKWWALTPQSAIAALSRLNSPHCYWALELWGIILI